MASLNITVAMTMIPLGFVVFIWGLDKVNMDWIYAGAAIIVIGIVMWIASIRKASNEFKDAKEERNNQVKTIVDSINAVSNNIGDLVKEIREDRNQRIKEKGKKHG